MKYWIKERHNSQTGTYFVACGQMSAKEAKAATQTLYGSNVMHGFKTKKQYETRITQLREEKRYIITTE